MSRPVARLAWSLMGRAGIGAVSDEADQSYLTPRYLFPRRHALPSAPKDSWWTTASRDGFTAMIEREHGERMRRATPVFLAGRDEPASKHETARRASLVDEA